MDSALSLAVLNSAYGTVQSALRPAPGQRVAPVTTMVAQACAAGHGWVAASGNLGTLTLNDTSYKPIGSQSIKLVTALPTRIDRTSLTLDLTGKQPVVWVSVDDVSKLNLLSLYLGDNGFANYYLWQFAPQQNGLFEFQSGEFVKIVLSFADATVSGAPNRAALTSARFYAEDRTTGPATVHFSGLASQPEPANRYPNGCVVFACDDARISQWTGMKPSLDRYGFPATAYVIAGRVDSDNGVAWLTTQMCQDMQNKSGWEIGAHAYSTAIHDQAGGFTGSTAAALEADFVNLKQWLAARGLRASDHVAYPQGFYNPTVLDLARRYYTSGRTVFFTAGKATMESWPPADPYRMRTMTLTSAGVSSLVNVKATVDKAKANKGVLILTVHALGTVADSLTWVQSDFDTLVDYVAASGVAVRTVGQMLRGE